MIALSYDPAAGKLVGETKALATWSTVVEKELDFTSSRGLPLPVSSYPTNVIDINMAWQPESKEAANEALTQQLYERKREGAAESQGATPASRKWCD